MLFYSISANWAFARFALSLPLVTFVCFHGRRATRKCTQNIKCFSSLQLLSSAALCLIHNALAGPGLAIPRQLSMWPPPPCPRLHSLPVALGLSKLRQKNTYNFISYLRVTALLFCIKCCDLKNTFYYKSLDGISKELNEINLNKWSIDNQQLTWTAVLKRAAPL